MAKHRRTWNERKYDRYIKDGRGQGTLSAYKPWITINDFASQGNVSRVHGMTTGRIHHLLSNHELRYFYLLDWSEEVCDIREQYPLIELDTVIEIAEKAGIRYPFDGTSGFPYVLTSDFLITTRTGEVARTIKAKKELEKSRVREKLEIERRYWTQKGVDWKIVTEDQINHQKARSIEWLLQAAYWELGLKDEGTRNEGLSYFEDMYVSSDYTVAELILMVEDEFDLQPGSGINLYKYLVLTKRIDFPMDSHVNTFASRITTDQTEDRAYE